jgi:manganese transport protein
MCAPGATVMPHNLYLHSSIIQTRAYPRTRTGKRMALLYGTWDSMLSLSVAFFINAAILILCAASPALHAHLLLRFRN